ncbi:uncharacterized protein LOC131674265 isoform X11 [Phymastichus coffea]|uniref:uncharacterized protein LOC131674265 isoform X11 n=1 Tax=Phymastichus coffea TaxID=108790 RepID=UPI00273BF069|nr:uncharacterized protein LOC131674265 isoform X11 [Phymastichus coffea]
MKFKISQQQGANSHSKAVTCVTWISSDEIYSCGDDHSLMCWKFEDGAINSRVVAELPEDFYPTDMQWQPRPAQASGVGAVKKQSLDVLLISTADGKFHLVSRAGRVEKSVQAHTGATLSGKWSQDGSALMTGKPIGGRRIARTGTNDNAWVDARSRRGRADKGLVAQRHAAFHRGPRQPRGVRVRLEPRRLVHPLLPGVVTARAVAHGERQAYQVGSSRRPRARRRLESIPRSHRVRRRRLPLQGLGRERGHPVRQRPGRSADNGAQLVLVRQLLRRRLVQRGQAVRQKRMAALHGEAAGGQRLRRGLVERRHAGGPGVQLRQRADRPRDREEARVRRLRGHLDQAQGRAGERGRQRRPGDAGHRRARGAAGVRLRPPGGGHAQPVPRLLGEELEHAGDSRPEGRLGLGRAARRQALPAARVERDVAVQLPGQVAGRAEMEEHDGRAALSTLRVRLLRHHRREGPNQSQTCARAGGVAEEAAGRGPALRARAGRDEPGPELRGRTRRPAARARGRQSRPVPRARALGRLRARLQNSGDGAERRLGERRQRAGRHARHHSVRLAVPQLPALRRPQARAQDARRQGQQVTRAPSLDDHGRTDSLSLSSSFHSEFGKQPAIVSVSNGLVTVRRGDGALVVSSFYAFVGTLHRHILNGQWDEAVSVCRIVQSDTLWTCLAVMAIDGRQLNIAEEACAAVARFDKVDYIRYIKVSGSPFYRSPFAIERSRPAVAQEMPNETERLAEMALLAGDLLGAEGILLQSAMIAEAIRMNLQMYNWSRALELALKHKKLLAEVLDARKRYLETLEKREVNRSFLAVYGNIAKAQAAKRVRVGVPIDAPRERVDGAAHPSLLLPGGAREGEGEGARGSGAQAARVQGRREEQRRRGEIDDPGEGLNRCGRFCSSASFVQSAVLSIFIR